MLLVPLVGVQLVGESWSNLRKPRQGANSLSIHDWMALCLTRVWPLFSLRSILYGEIKNKSQTMQHVVVVSHCLLQITAFSMSTIDQPRSTLPALTHIGTLHSHHTTRHSITNNLDTTSPYSSPQPQKQDQACHSASQSSQ